MKKVLKLYPDFNVVLCPDYVISTARQKTNLLSNFEYLLLLYFLIAAEFWNLGHLQGIYYKGALTQKK